MAACVLVKVKATAHCGRDGEGERFGAHTDFIFYDTKKCKTDFSCSFLYKSVVRSLWINWISWVPMDSESTASGHNWIDVCPIRQTYYCIKPAPFKISGYDK